MSAYEEPGEMSPEGGDGELENKVMHLRTQHLQWREIEGEVVVLDLKSSRYLAVNKTGYLMWKSLAGGATRAQLISELITTFSIDKETAEKDADDFIDSLERADLLGEAQ